MKFHLFSYTTMNHFWIGLWCNKSGLYMTTGNSKLSGWTKKLQSTFQTQTCTKKGHGHWWSAACLIHYSVLNPGESITSENYAQQINEMSWKLKHLQPALVHGMGPILLYHNTQPHIAQGRLQMANELGYEVLPHPPYSPDLSPTNYHSFKHLDNFFFARKMIRKPPVGCRKCFPRVHRIPKHGFLCYRNKQTYFLLAKMYWL